MLLRGSLLIMLRLLLLLFLWSIISR